MSVPGMRAFGLPLDPIEKMAGRYFPQEDPILASQVGRQRTWGPEQLLQLAVLEMAARDLQIPHQRDGVIRWMDDSREWGPTSFVGVCSSLDLDANKLREGMRAMGRLHYYRRTGVRGDGRRLSGEMWFGGSIGRPSGRLTAVNPEGTGRHRSAP